MKTFKRFAPKKIKLPKIRIRVQNWSKEKDKTPEYAKGKKKIIKRRKIYK